MSISSSDLPRVKPNASAISLVTIITDVVNTAMTIVGVQLIDRVGRRRLLIIGAVGMCFCEYIVAIVRVLTLPILALVADAAFLTKHRLV